MSPSIIRTPALRSLSSLTGRELWLARGNAAADLAARATVNRFVDRSSDYQQLVQRYFLREAAAKKIVKFHHAVALRCVGPHRQNAHTEVVQHPIDRWLLDEPIFLPPMQVASDVFCPEYAALLKAFFSELQWSPTGAAGELTDTSLVELCIWLREA